MTGNTMRKLLKYTKPPKPMNDEREELKQTRLGVIVDKYVTSKTTNRTLFTHRWECYREMEELITQARKDERKALIEKIKTEVIGEDEYSNEAYKMCDDPECECRQEDGEYSVKNNFRAEQRTKLSALKKEQ